MSKLLRVNAIICVANSFMFLKRLLLSVVVVFVLSGCFESEEVKREQTENYKILQQIKANYDFFAAEHQDIKIRHLKEQNMGGSYQMYQRQTRELNNVINRFNEAREYYVLARQAYKRNDKRTLLEINEAINKR